MRKLVLASALSGAMLSLAACSGAADETAETTDTSGASDTIFGNEGADLILGGALGDEVSGGAGRDARVPTHVHEAIDLEAINAPGLLHELPHSHRAGRRLCARIETALDHLHPDEIFG